MARTFLRSGLIVSLVLLGTSSARAQFKKPALGGLDGPFSNFADDPLAEPVTASAYFTEPNSAGIAILHVTAKIAPDWHIYSITQPAHGPKRTTLKLSESGGFSLVGNFVPDPIPKVHQDEVAFPGVSLEEHTGSVTWSAPIQLKPGTDAQKLRIEGAVNAQACKVQCNLPKDYRFVAAVRLGAATPADVVARPIAANPPATPSGPKPIAVVSDRTTAGVTEYRPIGVHAMIKGELASSEVAPGGTLTLRLTVSPEGGFHAYEYSDKERSEFKPTLIALASPDSWHIKSVQADRPPRRVKSAADAALELPLYEEPVTWTVEIAVPANEKPGKTELVGLIGLQTCSDQSCDLATGARFQTSVAIGDSARGGPVSLSFQEAKYRDVAQRAAEQPVAASPAQTPAASVSVRMMAVLLGLAFVAGLILNLMPCVLPVIGLKVLSFLQQAGQDRRQVFLLNLWYALGILSVFMVLGTFAVVAHLGWGAQFSSPSTNITLACIVFVFALSFLGVWEIPIPGFVGSGAAQDLASREGPTGAFLKGVLTTVLATPCVGPFLGPTLTEAIKHPWFVTYPVFAFVGLGMASPYLIIGANPSLLKWIPKPGQWMDTFKQLMGFILLGTVVWIMSSIDWPRVVPTFALMIGLWASCWWIGRTPLTEPLGRRLYAWSSAAVFAVAMGYVSFNLIEPAMQGRFELALDKEVLKREELLASRGGRDANDRLWQLFASEREDKLRQLKTTNSSELPWQPYSKSRLKMLQDRGYTVFVDFSAPWCATCHVNEHNALNTLPTQKLVEDLNIITLDANVDDDESAQTLAGLAGAGQGVPYYIIYPAGKADAPVHMGLNAVLTQDETLTKLREAGASKPIAAGMTANDPPRDVRTTSAEFSATKTSAPFANQKNARE